MRLEALRTALVAWQSLWREHVLSPILSICRRGAAAAAVLALATLLMRPAAWAGSVTPLPPVSDADGRLGLCDVLPGTTPSGVSWAALARDAGARVNRWEFRWDRLEPRRQTWDFTADDLAVDSSQGAGLQLLGILIGTPAWGAAKGQKPGNGVPAGLYLPPADSRNLWASYVREVVAHYRDAVDTWEVWNEPDLPFFWSGTSDDYFQLLRVSYLVIKATDPSATVMMAGMVAPDLGFTSRVLERASHDNQARLYGGFLDAVGWHVYGQAAQAYRNILRFRAILASKGFGDVPLWVTEDGFPASNPNGEARQAAYVLQTVAYSLAAGAQKALIYRASDDSLPKTWGLLAADGQPRLGYVAFQVAAHLFSHLRAITYVPGAHVERFALYRPNQRITVLWNHGVAGATVPVPASGASADLVSWEGTVSRAASADGRFKVQLPGASYNAGIDAPGSVVGGPPVFLVEDNRAQALQGPAVIPSLPGAHRRLVLLNHDTGAATVQVRATGNSAEHQVLHLPPTSLRTVDLDLLAGLGYSGSWSVSSSQPVAFTALSDTTTSLGTPPSTTWYLPGASGHITVTNPSARAVHVDISGYTATGARTIARSVSLPPVRTITFDVPAKTIPSLVLRAGAPVVAAAATSDAVSKLLPSWYLLAPHQSHISLFNPDPAAARADVRFIGSKTVTGQQIRLAARHSFSLRTHGARAIVVTGSRPLAVGYRGAGPRFPRLMYQPSTESAVTAAGSSTRVTVLNPSDKTAHISYVLVSRSGSVQQDAVVAPAHVASVIARRAGDAARGVIVRSDVAVVAEPAP